MIKRLFISVLFVPATFCVFGQSEFTTIKIDKKMQPGLVIHLPDNEAVAEGTLLKKLKETGYSPETTGSLFWKKNTKDGFYVFTGVQLPALNNQQVDMYFKVDRESKAKKEQSIIYLLVSKGYDNFIAPESDSASFAAAMAFLNGFVSTTASYRLQLDIDEQVAVLKKSEKKLADMQDDEKDISRKIADLQTGLRNKQNDQVLQQREIALQQGKLDQLKGTIKQ